MTEPTDHYMDFPFEEIRDSDGNYFQSYADALLAGYDDDQIWSVVHGDESVTVGPPHHYVNVLGYIATKERHNGMTYYHEPPEPKEDDE